MSEELCPICLQKLSEKDTYKIDCNHVFHTDCIMKWFRVSNGSCPCCADNPNIVNMQQYPIFYGYWNTQFLNKRCNIIKRYNNNNNNNNNNTNTNKSLTNNFEKLKRYETELKELKKEKREYLNDPAVKEMKKKTNDLIRTIFRRENQIKKIKINIVAKYPTVMIT